jgi:hypothetical protein
MTIEEIVGYNSSAESESFRQTRVYFMTADSPESATVGFRTFAEALELPDGMELESYELDEEKRANGVFFGKIVFSHPKIKTKIAADLEELFGEQKSMTRKSGTHTRTFRVKASTGSAALTRLENYIRAATPQSGRLQINDIAVEENGGGTGWFRGQVIYSNPEIKAVTNPVSGIAPAYGDRASITISSREGNTFSTERVYELSGFADAESALLALRGVCSTVGLEEIAIDEDAGGADKIYTGRVRYKNEFITETNSPTQDVPSYSFDVTALQTKMTCSLGTRASYAVNGRTPRDYGGLIGVTDDGVEGVDLDVAAAVFSETMYFSPDVMTADYIAFITGAYGCVNSVPWRGFNAGEVRFLGATGNWREDEYQAELTFRFAVSLNESNFRVGDIPIEFKYGWDYLWVRQQNVDRNGITVKYPVEAYIEQVYRYLDFRTLGIGR